jgi:hypothetical protein
MVALPANLAAAAAILHTHRDPPHQQSGTSAALGVLSGYDQLMIEEDREERSDESDAASITSDEMSEALDAVKAASPSLAGTLDAARVTPEGLADSHGRATSDEPDAAHSAAGEENKRD